MSAPLVEPSACRWCGIPKQEHARQFADAVGWHAWVLPTNAQMLARMQARRLAQVVARVGALPMSVGPAPQALSAERLQEIAESHPGDWYSGEWRSEYMAAGEYVDTATYVVTHAESETLLAELPDWAGPLALFFADAHDAVPELLAEVRRLRAQVAELLAERHVTNEALDDAVRELRARQAPTTDGITRRFAPTQALREEPSLKGRARLDELTVERAEATHWKRLGLEDQHDSPLHRTDRIPRDLEYVPPVMPSDAGDVVAYRDPQRPQTLLCREHGPRYIGMTPVTAEDLPDGGVCTYGGLSSLACGRDVLADGAELGGAR